MSKINIKPFALYIMSFLVLFVAGCNNQTGRTISFPNRSIVFQANDGENYKLGFMNDDGNQVELYTTNDATRITQPVWSHDKEIIYFRIIAREHPGIENQNVAGYIGILKNGKAPEAVCEDILSSGGALIPTQKNGILLTMQGTEIGFANLTNCTWKKIIESQVGFCSYSLSSDEKLILYSEITEDKCILKSFHLETEELKMIGEGKNASYSPDQYLIAFIRPEGIFAADANGENLQELIHFDLVTKQYKNFYDIPTNPVWSPDGKWLIYHKCATEDGQCDTTNEFSIFKLRLSDKYEVKIYDNGLNPNWQ